MRQEKATFAGGCFWCLQPVFDRIDGVCASSVGFMGGDSVSPTYEDVCRGGTGHREVIQVLFDPTRVDYEALLQAFWESIDPTQSDGQFADRGEHYRTAIFYHSEHQRFVAKESRRNLERSERFSSPIVTEILPAKEFFQAEESHQEYYKKNPWHYERYAEGSGRKPYLRKVWGS